MDLLNLTKAAAMGIVEGLTEFLPISSTGHLILVGDLLGATDEKWKVFEVIIQTGAMFAILVEYRARFVQFVTKPLDKNVQRLAINLAVAFIPAAILGFLFNKPIKAHLFKPLPVAFAFIVGAYVILWVESRKREPRVHSIDAMRPSDAWKVGLVQCAALIPGTSRAGATIIGGILLGLSRRAAAEFSFFLAVPTLMAAGAYDLWKNRGLLHAADLPIFLVGSVTAFISAFFCVRFLLRYISTRDFSIFAWYRIAFGLVVLGTTYLGWIRWTVE